MCRFSQPDVEEGPNTNVVFEESSDSSGEAPLLRGGTLLKIIERHTFHSTFDPKTLRTLLITFRDFCTPSHLLDLLIERYAIHRSTVHLQM